MINIMKIFAAGAASTLLLSTTPVAYGQATSNNIVTTAALVVPNSLVEPAEFCRAFYSQLSFKNPKLESDIRFSLISQIIAYDLTPEESEIILEQIKEISPCDGFLIVKVIDSLLSDDEDIAALVQNQSAVPPIPAPPGANSGTSSSDYGTP